MSYFSYWTQKLVEVLLDYNDSNISINRLAEMTSIKHTDILKVLEDLNLIRYHQGQHIILSDKNLLNALHKKAGRPGYHLDENKLIWTPFKIKYDI